LTTPNNTPRHFYELTELSAENIPVILHQAQHCPFWYQLLPWNW
jgi:hypothetical protein